MISRSTGLLRGRIFRLGLIGAAVAVLTFTAGPKALSRDSQQSPKKAGNRSEEQEREANADRPRHGDRRRESGPIVINISDVTNPEWRMLCPEKLNGREQVMAQEKCHGTANLTFNPDGSWNFSGNYAYSEQDSHMQFVLGVKDSKGSLILFTADSPSTMEGFVWSKQGHNRTIKDNWRAFSKGYDYYWKCRVQMHYNTTPESSDPDFDGIFGDIGKALGVVATAAAIL